MSRVTLYTPTFARDFARFCLQRESIERCGIDLPHIAVVQDEHLAMFRDVPHQKNLTLLSTKDVLPRDIEKRRHVWGISRRDYRYWITGKGVHGWMSQQLVKLSAPKVVTTPAVVCVDSDTFFVRRATDADWFATDGRLHRYETEDDCDVEMAEWYAHAMRFFGVKTSGATIRRFTHQTLPMHVGMVAEMTRSIEKKHGRSWCDVLVDADGLMEYTLYGTYARHVDAAERTVPVRPAVVLNYWWQSEAERVAETLEANVLAGGFKAVAIQSNTGKTPDEYRDILERVWPKQEAALAAGV